MQPDSPNIQIFGQFLREKEMIRIFSNGIPIIFGIRFNISLTANFGLPNQNICVALRLTKYERRTVFSD